MNYLKAILLIIFIFTLGIAQSQLEELEKFQREAIEQGNVVTPSVTSQGGAPEGIYGWVKTLEGNPAHWSWVKATGYSNPHVTCWVHTSWWSNWAWPYYSNFYCMNANTSWAYIERGQKYYIYAFRWLPADEARAYLPPRPSVPSQPAWAEGMSYSDVYLTPYPYDYEHNGGRLQQEIDPVLRYIKMW